MDSSTLVKKVQGLTDIELAILLSLVAKQHCIVQTEEEILESLEKELQLV